MALDERKKLTPGFNTEYNDNYKWDQRRQTAGSWNKEASGLFNTDASELPAPTDMLRSPPELDGAMIADIPNTDFYSSNYPSVYRETVIHKDDRGSYIDPYKGLSSKPYGRRLRYDQSHPMKMYASQWSSELADAPGVYSFPTTTGLEPEMPWRQDMSWRMEGQEAHWPTDAWKHWTKVAECPPYDGHSDQPEYSQYKVQVP